MEEKNLCLHEGCTIVPSYHYAGKKNPIYCFIHKNVEMVDIVSDHWVYAGLKMIFNKDSINKTCNSDGCNNKPLFQLSGNKSPQYCFLHKQIIVNNITEKPSGDRMLIIAACLAAAH